MGNASSHQSKREPPPKAQPATSTSTTSTPVSTAPPPLPRTTSRLGRSLKGKKRSIVDHPQLLAAPQGPTAPSAPIPIPVPNRGGGFPPPPRATPPLNMDSTDDVPDLLSNNPIHNTLRPAQLQLQQQPLPYNSTRSFGRVRRGGLMGVVDGMFVEFPPPPPSPPFKEELVRSTIPLRIGQPAPRVQKPKKKGKQPVREVVVDDGSIPTHIIWRDGGKNVFIAGTFAELEWRARDRMRFDPITCVHMIVLNLHPGTYRLKFIVDDIWRCSEDMPTAVDDQTGNLVNYIDVEDPSAIDLSSPPSGAEELQIIDARVMKANRRRTYPSKVQANMVQPLSSTQPPQRQPKPQPQPQPQAHPKPKPRPHTRSPTTSRYHPPLLPPSESVFWGDLHDESETELEGWERGRDGVLEKWTNVVPEGLIAAAQQEEAYNAQKQKRRERGGEREREGRQGEREKRHGKSERYKAMGWAGRWAGGGHNGAPNLPPPPRLPRHLDKVILNTKSSQQPSAASGSGSSGSGSHSGRSKSGKHKSRSRTAALNMTSILLPGPEARRAGASTLVPGLGPEPPRPGGIERDKEEQTAMERASAALIEHWAQHAQADDSSVLPVPSHVVLHHLGTSAIKNGVLAVSDTTRYNKKYITTIYYKPT